MRRLLSARTAVRRRRPQDSTLPPRGVLRAVDRRSTTPAGARTGPGAVGHRFASREAYIWGAPEARAAAPGRAPVPAPSGGFGVVGSGAGAAPPDVDALRALLTSRPPSGGGDAPDDGGGTRHPSSGPDRTGGGGGQARPARRTPRGDGGPTAVPRPTRSPQGAGGQERERAAAQPDVSSVGANEAVVVGEEVRAARPRAQARRTALPRPGALARRRTVRRALDPMPTSGPTARLGGTGAQSWAGAPEAVPLAHAFATAGVTRSDVGAPPSGALLARRRLITPAPLATTAAARSGTTAELASDPSPTLGRTGTRGTGSTHLAERPSPSAEATRPASAAAWVRRRVMTPAPLATRAAARRSVAAPVHQATTGRAHALADLAEAAPRELAAPPSTARTGSRLDHRHPQTPSVAVVQRTTRSASPIGLGSQPARLGARAPIHAIPAPQPSAPVWFAPAIPRRSAPLPRATPGSATRAVPGAMARRSTPPTPPTASRPDVRAIPLTTLVPLAADHLVRRMRTSDALAAPQTIARQLAGPQGERPSVAAPPMSPVPNALPRPGRQRLTMPLVGARTTRLSDLLPHSASGGPSSPVPMTPARRPSTLRRSATLRGAEPRMPEVPDFPATHPVIAPVLRPNSRPSSNPNVNPAPAVPTYPPTAVTSGRPAPSMASASSTARLSHQSSPDPRPAADRVAARARRAHADGRLLNPERRVLAVQRSARMQQRTLPADGAAIQQGAALPLIAAALPTATLSTAARRSPDGHPAIARRTVPGFSQAVTGGPVRPSPTALAGSRSASRTPLGQGDIRRSPARPAAPSPTAAGPATTRALGVDRRARATSPMVADLRAIAGTGPRPTADVSRQRGWSGAVRPMVSGPPASVGSASEPATPGGRPPATPTSSSDMRGASGTASGPPPTATHRAAGPSDGPSGSGRRWPSVLRTRSGPCPRTWSPSLGPSSVTDQWPSPPGRRRVAPCKRQASAPPPTGTSCTCQDRPTGHVTPPPSSPTSSSTSPAPRSTTGPGSSVTTTSTLRSATHVGWQPRSGDSSAVEQPRPLPRRRGPAPQGSPWAARPGCSKPSVGPRPAPQRRRLHPRRRVRPCPHPPQDPHPPRRAPQRHR